MSDITLRQILTELQKKTVQTNGCSDTINVYGGKSAYLSSIEMGFLGTEAEWVTGLSGKTAYQHAIESGAFVGTMAEWLASLNGTNGEDGEVGDSAFEIAQDAGFMGDEAAGHSG